MLEDTSYHEYRSARIEARFSGSTEIYRQRNEMRAAARAAGSNAPIAIPSLNGASLPPNATPLMNRLHSDLVSLPTISEMLRPAMQLRFPSSLSSGHRTVAMRQDCDQYSSDETDETEADKENIIPQHMLQSGALEQEQSFSWDEDALFDDDMDEHPSSDDSVDLPTSEADLGDIMASALEASALYAMPSRSSSVVSTETALSDCNSLSDESVLRVKRRRIWDSTESNHTEVSM
ncbi:hypothetical protein SYNPS1DRAFT_27946 [Syncephalis pseudoplumigaleata]|uniref:Uncharacterized protein n=1 Tax=Syncephalis pseudoplumigaleata TaxID=1712513 RepID=A0A4V1J1V3_9FUNG|nr:hypothetical protein SYNPS1DRAFT_27946 [Syncephalis pseudoplumigaleata]|eukprot:RKP26359.1 hypothetical protein SYNPS1DRAFT_27946 [Syncephalis pseudoplumigaleata]